jgi:hypothetical protein
MKTKQILIEFTAIALLGILYSAMLVLMVI